MILPTWAVVVLVFTLLPSITGYKRVEGWPVLRVEEHIVSTEVMGDACAPETEECPGSIAFGCAHFYFDEGVCRIYVSYENPSWRNVLEHEREHCAGKDHWIQPLTCRGKSMGELLQEWQASRRSKAH